MKQTAKNAACVLAPLALAFGCKSKPVDVGAPGAAVGPAAESAQAAQSASQNIFIGTWIGKDKSGAAYSIKFTNDLQWESHIEESGSVRPHYKGTYEPEGTRVRMKVTHEADMRTFGWRPERGNMPTTIIGTLSGSALTVGSVLTNAELKRH